MIRLFSSQIIIFRRLEFSTARWNLLLHITWLLYFLENFASPAYLMISWLEWINISLLIKLVSRTKIYLITIFWGCPGWTGSYGNLDLQNPGIRVTLKIKTLLENSPLPQNVTLKFQFEWLHEIDPETSSLGINLILNIWWKDSRLSWNQTEYMQVRIQSLKNF